MIGGIIRRLVHVGGKKCEIDCLVFGGKIAYDSQGVINVDNMNRIDSIKAASLKRRTIVEKISGNITSCILQSVIENAGQYIVRQYVFSHNKWGYHKNKHFDTLDDAESYIEQQIKQHRGN